MSTETTTTFAPFDTAGFDAILIYAKDAVSVAEQAETAARAAHCDAKVTNSGNARDRQLEYSTRCALVAAMGAASTARATLRKICEFGLAQIERDRVTDTVIDLLTENTPA